MKKAFKIIGISLASIIVVIIIAVVVVFWILLTPERVTPIVRQQAENYITCQTNLESVDVVLFKTFPNIGLRIHNLTLINPIENANSDTLAHVGECIVSVNAREFLANNSIIVTQFFLKDGKANIYVDSLGNANYDILDIESSDDDTSEFKIEKIDLDKIVIENMNFRMNDYSSNLHAATNNLNLKVKGKMKGEDIVGDIHLKTGVTSFSLIDSTSMSVTLNEIETTLKGEMKNKNIAGDVHFKTGKASFSLIDSTSIFATANEVETSFKGDVEALNHILGNLHLQLSNASFRINEDNYLDSANINLHAPLSAFLDKLSVSLDKAKIMLNDNHIHLKGDVLNIADSTGMTIDVAFETNTWDLHKTLSLIPAPFKHYLDGISASGKVSLLGNAKGIYNDSIFPVVAAKLSVKEGKCNIKDIPFPLTDIHLDVDADVDLNNLSNLKVHNLQAKTGSNSLSCSGTVNDFLDKIDCDLNVATNLNLTEFKSMFPSTIKAEGLANATIHAKFNMDQINRMAIEEMKANGNLVVAHLNAEYNDSIKIKSPKAEVDFALPSPSNLPNQLVHANIKSKEIDAEMIDFLKGNLKDVYFDVDVSNFLDTTSLPSVVCDFKFKELKAKMDTISVDIKAPSGHVSLKPVRKGSKIPKIEGHYKNENLLTQLGKDNTVKTKDIKVDFSAIYDEKQKDILSQLNPKINVFLQQGLVDMDFLPVAIDIPGINFVFTPKKINIAESKIVLDKHSDFNLSGTITDIDKYMKKEGLLKADLNFNSENTHVSEIISLVTGIGVPDSAMQVELESPEDNPFMVPMGVDVSVKTMVKKVHIGKSLLENLGGHLTIKDGIMVLEEMGFVCDAAKMQLTAIYRSPRKNHLYAGIDFHLLDIDIANLIDMIPDIDTIVPMLKSFAGKAEFHFAIETNLKSNYDLKMSTLQGAAAISGKDLVLMDGKTFSKISKILLFKKKTENKVDSISVEMKIFRNGVVLYPFLIAMDKYKAVIAGNHNVRDMTFKYHISVTETPIKLRLGANISGTLDKLKFRLARCQYKRLFRPEKRNEVDNKTLELKSIISNSLKSGVKSEMRE